MRVLEMSGGSSVSLAILALACLVACQARSAGDAPADVVRIDGIGALRVGMTVQEAAQALGEELDVEYTTFESCDHVASRTLPAGVALMVVADTIVRVEVSAPGVRTEAGAEVGTTERRLLELYGERADVTPHPYSGPEWHSVTVLGPGGDSAHAVVFETDGQVVQKFRAGRRPEVGWVEGCA